MFGVFTETTLGHEALNRGPVDAQFS